MTNTIEVLKAARELISDPAHWTQGTYAKDVNGRRTLSRDDDAACWCSIGAIQRIAGECGDADLPEEALDALQTEISARFSNTFTVADFNDCNEHPAVLAIFDAAIARLA